MIFPVQQVTLFYQMSFERKNANFTSTCGKTDKLALVKKNLFSSVSSGNF